MSETGTKSRPIVQIEIDRLKTRANEAEAKLREANMRIATLTSLMTGVAIKPICGESYIQWVRRMHEAG